MRGRAAAMWQHPGVIRSRPASPRSLRPAHRGSTTGGRDASAFGARLGRVLLPFAALAVVAAPILAAAPALAVDGNVSIVDFAFQPGDVTIALNEKVTWFNQSPDNHTVTSDTGAFDSGSLPPYGGGYQLIFQRSGTFPYHCGFHPQMKGIIRVGGGSGTPPPPVATTTRPPTTTPPSPGGTTTSTLATTVLPPPIGGATTTSTTPLAGIVTTTSSSSSTSTTSLFSPPTSRKNVASGSNNGDDRTKRRWFGAIAAALAAAGTLATIFVARRPAGPPQYEAPPGWGGPQEY
jgi:plastocyanin